MDFRADHRRIAAALVLAVCAASCGGCASRVADATPAGARGPVDTGTYPNLNVLPRLSTDQFTNDTLLAHNQAIVAASTSQHAQDGAAVQVYVDAMANEKRLRRLGAVKGQDVLGEIERPAAAAAPAAQ